VYTVIKSGAGDKKKRIARLAELGGSLNRATGAEASPLVTAASWFGRYDLCLLLLDLGADPRQYEGDELTKITHLIDGTLRLKARGTGQLRDASPEQLADFERLVERLEAMGETLAAARADKERWASEPDNAKRYAMRHREIAERKERERREREAAEQQGAKKAPEAPASKAESDSPRPESP
jgi:hypothetical protein